MKFTGWCQNEFYNVALGGAGLVGPVAQELVRAAAVLAAIGPAAAAVLPSLAAAQGVHAGGPLTELGAASARA